MTALLEQRLDARPAVEETPAPAGEPAAAILARHPLFHPLTPAEIGALTASGRRGRYERGRRLFSRGDAGGPLALVLAGAVRVSVRARSGAEIVHNVVQAGEAFGEVGLFDARPRSADAIAASDCEILWIDRAEALPLLVGRPEVARNALTVLGERLRRACSQIEDALFADTAARLAHAILRHAQPVGGLELRLRVTQKQLGEMIGLSRESTNKQLQVWVRRGWIEVEKGGVLVRDAAALSAVSAPRGD